MDYVIKLDMLLDNMYKKYVHYLSIAYQLVEEIGVQNPNWDRKYLVISFIFLGIGQGYSVFMVVEGSGYLVE